MKLGIRGKLILFAVCVALLSSLGSALFVYFQQRREILYDVERTVKDIATLTAASVFDEVYRLDISGLRQKLRAVRANPDLSYTYVTDVAGLVLADGSAQNPLRDQKLADPFSALMRASADWVTRIEGDSLKVGGPLRGPDKQRVGYLQMGFSLARMHDDLHDAVKAIAYAGVIGISLGVALAFLLGAALSEPIRAIAEACRQIGAGNLKTSLAADRSDELGAVAHAVNSMALALQRKIDRVKTAQQINQAITTTLELPAILELLTGKIERLLPESPVIIVELIDREGEQFQYVEFRNVSAEQWLGEYGGKSRAIALDGLARAALDKLGFSAHPRFSGRSARATSRISHRSRPRVLYRITPRN